jgi:hypothetical protein
MLHQFPAITAAVPRLRTIRLRHAVVAGLVVWGLGAPAAADPLPEPDGKRIVPAGSDGMFLPAADGNKLWERTLRTIAADWPVVQTVPPDFTAIPPRAGRIESAWVEPPAAPSQTGLPVGSAWPPQRQRVVVQLMPAAGGAWIDAVVETQSLDDLDASLSPDRVSLTGGWQAELQGETTADVTTMLAARLALTAEPIYALPPPPEIMPLPRRAVPWADSRFPRLSRAGHKVWQDYKYFYAPDRLVCLTAAFGAGALMANTGFDTTMQDAWQTGVRPTELGTFFSGCKDIGEGRYTLPIYATAAATGLVFEGRPVGDALGGWGSRSLRIFVVGAPPLYVLQWATGASRPGETSAGSDWKFFQDYNGVSGHAFVGAIPFLAAADMVESPLAKGTLYVCSTFVGFSRMTDDAHYPSQIFLGWYLAWASSLAVSRTEQHFAGMEVRVVPLPIGDQGGMGVEARW